ncbi:hypothetical protein AA0112_g7391 [Alternaria arborescens]|jgi:hypothetical protein|nr:hypothetical protein AA0112_g7391 [Alternaria arborescens]
MVYENDMPDPCAMPHNGNKVPIAAPRSGDATDDGLRLMLDLPTELRCYILELLIIDGHSEAYNTLLEHPEVREVVRCNFNTQFRAVKPYNNLAGQLQQILTTTALLSTHTNRLRSHELAKFLANNLVDENPHVSVDSSSQAFAVLRKYQIYLIDAETLTDQFAKITIGNAAARYSHEKHPRYGADTLSKVEHHRILRAFLRLQLYIEIRKLYGARRSLKRKLRGLFSLWTTWEFDEVRSLVEWIKIERSSLPKHYAKSIRKLFALVDAHFYNDMAPYVKARPDLMRDRHRRPKFAKKSKRWNDTHATLDEGRADARNKDWRPLGYTSGCCAEYTQRVYQELFLAGGCPFWSRFTTAKYGWWHYRNIASNLQSRFGQVYVTERFWRSTYG